MTGKLISDFFQNRLNLNELAYDCAIVFFPFILKELYSPMMASAPFGIPFILIFLLCSIYFLPVLIGKMYNTDFKDSPPIIRKSVLTIFFTTLLFVFISLLVKVIPSGISNPSTSAFIFITGIVFLIMGPIAGLTFTGKDTLSGEYSTQVMVFLFTIGILPLFYLLISGKEIFGDINGLLVFLLITGLMIGDVILIFLIFMTYMLARKLVIRIGIYNLMLSAGRLFAPFCVAFILVFFNMYSDRIFLTKGRHSVKSISLIIFLYVITGVLPLRIMLMLAPPVRPLSILMGVTSLIIMLSVII